MLAFAIGGSLTAYSQTKEQAAKILSHYNLEEGKVIIEQLAQKSNESYQRALELANANGWPLSIKKDGYESILIGVNSNDTPIYIQPYNDDSVFTARVNMIHPGGSMGLNLAGQGMLLGIWEPGNVRTTHVDLSGAVTVKDGSTFNGDNDNNSHATHVAGTLIGRGVSNDDARGFAYQANLFAYNSFSDVSEALAAAQDATSPLLVSNHSYGPNAQFIESWQRGAYIDDSYNWDVVCNQAPYYQPVFAAGNDRVGESRDWLVAEATAKNVLVVAAATSISTSNPTPSQIGMSSFSSYGPTDDRRIKPDIAADGVGLLSCHSLNDFSLTTKSGTSMASPSTAGTLILLQQHYSNLKGEFMRAATLRGLVIHTATEAGYFDGPDHRFGWGLLNGAAAAQVITGAHNEIDAYIEERALVPGTTYTKPVTASGAGKLKVSICWTDPARVNSINNGTNNSSTPVLTNDLDVRVNKDGNTYFPWRLNPLVEEAPIQQDNEVDNVEVIEIANPVAGGIYNIVVSHKGALQGFNSQNYTLIITGVTDVNSVSDKEKPTIGVYPNPASDVVNLTLNNSLDFGDAELSLYDAQGRLVRNYKTFIDKIDVSGLTSGIYMLNIKLNDGTYSETKKIVINR